ncbi:MAG TPA: FimV/HubP family polar landmark protein [Gammaproteobacteria bacterium]
MLIPTLGFALGLGDIQLRSGLNQQLDAEIELLSVDSSEVDKIAVSLASYETFAKLGVDRPAILMNLNFEVLKRPSGAPYIKVKSKSLINEPFLDFLVEVKWPTGKMLREYTLLLEPPEMLRQEPLMVDAPEVYEEPSVAEASQPLDEPLSVVPEPLVSAPVDAAGEMAEGETTEGEMAGEEPQPLAEPSETTPSAPVEAVAQVETEQPMGSYPVDTAEVQPAPSPAAELVYGPVKRNEALWRIANRMRPDDSVSVEQMMIALFNANRGAFIQGNINRLRKGAVLRIEDPAALRALSHAEARREVARHGRAWEEYRSRVAAKTPDSAPAAETQEPAKAGAAVAAAPVKEEPKLSLVAPQQKGDTGKSAVGGTDEKGVEVESLRKDLLLATESAEARRKENEELNKRLKELEGQLDKMQKLLTLKSDELTAMQQKLGSQPAPGAAPVEQAAPPAQPALVEPSPTETPAVPAEVRVPETAPAVGEQPSAAGETPATTGAETPAASDAAAPTETAPVVSEGAKPEAAQAPATPAAPVKPIVPKPPKPIQPIPEPSLIDKVLNDPLLLGGGAAGLLILLLAIMMVIKKSRQGRGFQESILTVGATSSMMKGKGDNPASETSFLSDLAISGMGGRVQEESDVDPLKEADVYLTFNKFQPAEELLKEGLRHNPERDDLHAKLLEVYYKSKNSEAFEKHATERAASLQKNESQWQKIVAMGHELAPENPLFAGAAVAAGAALLAADRQDSSATSEVFDIGLDLDALSSEMEAAGSAGSDFNVDLGLDFSDLGGEGEADQQKADESTTESANLDFDLSGFGMETDTPQPVASEPVQAEESLLGGLDFDLSAMAGEPPVSEESAALDFGDFDLGATAQESTPEAENAIDFGSLDFGGSEELTGSAAPDALDFGDLDLGSTAGDASMDIADLGDMGDLGDMSSFGSTDEIGTKLDLAKAYVDMGDAEGARGMLEEVIQEGSDDQKRQAKELLLQIA